MDFLKDNYGNFWFINSNPSTKCPCIGYNKQYRLKDWNGKKGKQYTTDILPHFKVDYDEKLSYGIKHGLQPNGAFTIGIDFDIVGKSGDTITHNDKTEQLFEKFIKITDAGVWSSGTEGNYGCLCVINSDTIKHNITELNQDKIEVDGVELLFQTHHILPPSKSKCKKSGDLRARVYLNENNKVCYVENGDEVEAFILDLILTYAKPINNEKYTKPKQSKNSVVRNETKPTKTISQTHTIETHTIECEEENSITDEDQELADIIDTKYIDNYNDWTKLIWACRTDDNFELAHYISQRGNKYDGDDAMTRMIYNDFKESRNGFSKATFYHYAKISDPDAYATIRAKYHPFTEVEDITDNDLAKTFVKLYGYNHIYYDKAFYFFNGVLWERSESGRHLKKSLLNDLSMFYKNEAKNVKKRLRYANDFERQQLQYTLNLLNGIVKRIQNSTSMNNLTNVVKVYIERSNEEVEFETNPYLFAFKNKIYDLKHNDWIEPCREDYLCVSTGYNWSEPDAKDIETFEEFLKTIFPLADERKLYMTILATGLCGKTLEKFINANGSGGNGKGVINELAEMMFGNYSYNCANAVLLGPIKDGNNPTVANMRHKRIIFYREPDTTEQKKLNIATIKELTGGKALNARMNYSNDTKTVLVGTHILECNERPKLSGRVDDAVVRRLIDIPFRSVFTADPTEYFGDYVFEKNEFYKSVEFQTKFKCVLFKVLCKYWKQYQQLNENIDLFICDSVKERTSAYLEANDEFKSWFDERYTQTKVATDVLQIKDIYNAYKNGELWLNLSKRERRELNKRNFIEKVSGNIHFRKFYKEREKSKAIQQKYGVTLMRNVLIGFKETENADSETSVDVTETEEE